MPATRIVATLAAPEPTALARFHAGVFDLDPPVDPGWIPIAAAGQTQRQAQTRAPHLATGGGSGTELPAVSIGVDDLDGAEAAKRTAVAEITHGPGTQHRGLRRFHFRAPAGTLVNVVDH